DTLELLLNLVENALGVHLDVAFGVIADAGDEHQVAVRDRAVEQRRLVGPAAVSVMDLLDRLLALRRGGGGQPRRGSGGRRGRAALDETASIRWRHVGLLVVSTDRYSIDQNINFTPSWTCLMFGYVVLVALIRPNVAEPNTAFGLP